MTYLITGGCGFIGFHLTLELIKRGHKVVIVDNFNDFYDPAIKEERAKALIGAMIYKEDILNLSKLEEIFSKHSFDRVIHLAAQPGVLQSHKTPETYQLNNVEGTQNVFECCRKYNIENTVFASSSSVYLGNKPPFKEDDEIKEGISIYAQTKRANELLAKTYNEKYDLNMVGLRMFNVYGTHGRPDLVFYIFAEALSKNEPIVINGDGNTIRDFTSVKDIVEGIILSAELKVGYEIINLGNSNPASLEKLVTLLEDNLQTKAIKSYIPKDKIDMNITLADITKAKELLNWSPKITMEEAIAELVAWHKSKNTN